MGFIARIDKAHAKGFCKEPDESLIDEKREGYRG